MVAQEAHVPLIGHVPAHPLPGGRMEAWRRLTREPNLTASRSVARRASRICQVRRKTSLCVLLVRTVAQAFRLCVASRGSSTSTTSAAVHRARPAALACCSSAPSPTWPRLRLRATSALADTAMPRVPRCALGCRAARAFRTADSVYVQATWRNALWHSSSQRRLAASRLQRRVGVDPLPVGAADADFEMQVRCARPAGRSH